MSSAGAGFDAAVAFGDCFAGDFVGAFVDDAATGFNAFVVRCDFTAFDDFDGTATAADAAFAPLDRAPSVTLTVCLPADLPAARAPGARMVLLDIGPLLDQLPR